MGLWSTRLCCCTPLRPRLLSLQQSTWIVQLPRQRRSECSLPSESSCTWLVSWRLVLSSTLAFVLRLVPPTRRHSGSSFHRRTSAADESAKDLIKSFVDNDYLNPAAVPNCRSGHIYSSSLPLVHVSFGLLNLAEARSTVACTKPPGIRPSSISKQERILANATEFTLAYYFDNFFSGIPRPVPFAVTTPTTVYSITTSNGTYLARHGLVYSS